MCNSDSVRCIIKQEEISRRGSAAALLPFRRYRSTETAAAQAPTWLSGIFTAATHTEINTPDSKQTVLSGARAGTSRSSKRSCGARRTASSTRELRRQRR